MGALPDINDLSGSETETVEPNARPKAKAKSSAKAAPKAAGKSKANPKEKAKSKTNSKTTNGKDGKGKVKSSASPTASKSAGKRDQPGDSEEFSAAEADHLTCFQTLVQLLFQPKGILIFTSTVT